MHESNYQPINYSVTVQHASSDFMHAFIVHRLLVEPYFTVIALVIKMALQTSAKWITAPLGSKSIHLENNEE